MTRERTLQQRDPLAALVARPTSYLAAAVVPVYATVSTIVGGRYVSHPTLAAFAVFLTVVAGVALAVQSSPLRAPLTSRVFVFVLGATVLAHIVSVLSMWTTDSLIRDNWGPIAIGLYLAALSPYRPAKQLATGTVLAAIVVAVAAIAQAPYLTAQVSPLAFAIVAVTPVVAMGVAAAAFADVLVRSLDRWRVRTSRAFSAMTDQRGESIARSVQQDRVTILNQEVVPFFTAILEGETVTEETRERAREIADTIRVVMVAEVDRTWLDVVMDDAARLANGGSGAVSAIVRDEERLAEHMSADQRTALRALVVALHREGAIDPARTFIDITADDGRCEVLLDAPAACDDSEVRADIAPFLAVMRVVFTDLHIDNDQPTLTVRFSYEQR
jgi:hypothetical protein